MERATKNVRLGMTLPMGGADKAVEVAQGAKDRGYEEIWMAEVNGGDSYALAGAVAQGLPGTRIGTAVVPAQTRTPMMHAMAAMTLSQQAADAHARARRGVASDAERAEDDVRRQDALGQGLSPRRCDGW
ncbi:MAG: LLM class flavin-dependent oxidoreductase [Deltaproteobacteria bacterium]|nr:LLM class flavin-dependent oxidoreductase [Deltaproteobacteria bacterium]